MDKSFGVLVPSRFFLMICAACFVSSPSAAFTSAAPRQVHTARTAQTLPVVIARTTANGSDQTDASLPRRPLLAPGSQTVSGSLNVTKANVVISDHDATLVASNPGNLTIVMSGQTSTRVGVTPIRTGKTRLATRAPTRTKPQAWTSRCSM